ncbi:hypothetical protein SADUNF_Sadunf16G0288600 [Salix dunnii]|uniref:Photosystem I assembly protein Ycf4 n=1 Tax=Salix dunnii TaxID=1413687 RepID=A0A835MHT8_9ROSI|nr:hypothetical protein SADUNF_Sadunf16G0288600 [Salix dunnii]
MSWRSEYIWIELIAGSREISNFCWAIIFFLGSLGFLLIGISSYLDRNLISLFPSQEINFFPQGIVMSLYGLAGSGYDRLDRKEGIVCIFRWGFLVKYRRILLRLFMKDIQSIRIEVKVGFNDRRVLYMEIEQKAAELAYFLRVPIEVF